MSSVVTGNKAELAAKLGVSLPTLSGWILRYPDFPVLSRGSNGRSYVFDFPVVFGYLRDRQQEQARSKAERDEALAQLKLPFDVPGADAPPAVKQMSAKEEIEVWRLRKLQREEAEAAGRLIPIAETQAALAAVLGRLNRDVHAFIRQVAREQSWPDSYARTLEARFGDLQRAAVRDLKEQLGAASIEGDDVRVPAYA